MTMSSREIAELTGKEHKNVIRDIRTMLDSLQEDGSDLSHQFREEKDARGYTSMFHIDRELTDTLLTGYSIPLRRKVIARWHELEAPPFSSSGGKAKRSPQIWGGVGMIQILVHLNPCIAMVRSRATPCNAGSWGCPEIQESYP